MKKDSRPADERIQPFDLDAYIADQDRQHPGFAADVAGRVAALRVGDRLRELRRAQHITQAQLAGRLGVTQSAIAQIEKAEPGRTTIHTLTKIAAAIGYAVTVDFLPLAAPPPPTRRKTPPRKRAAA